MINYDIFIGIGGALNAVPEALGEAISGGMTSGSGLSGSDFHLQMCSIFCRQR